MSDCMKENKDCACCEILCSEAIKEHNKNMDNVFGKIKFLEEEIIALKNSHHVEKERLNKKIYELEQELDFKSDIEKIKAAYDKTKLHSLISNDEALSQEFDDVFNSYKIFRDKQERDLRKENSTLKELITGKIL